MVEAVHRHITNHPPQTSNSPPRTPTRPVKPDHHGDPPDQEGHFQALYDPPQRYSLRPYPSPHLRMVKCMLGGGQCITSGFTSLVGVSGREGELLVSGGWSVMCLCTASVIAPLRQRRSCILIGNVRSIHHAVLGTHVESWISIDSARFGGTKN
jgi:hypothetical protein